MLWRVWSVVVAAICGIAISALSAGSFSGLSLAAMAACVAVGLAATVWHAAGRRHRPLDVPPGAPVSRREVQEEQRQRSQQDKRLASDLVTAVDSRVVAWLRRETFSGQWRDEGTESLRRVAAFDIGGVRFTDPGAAGAARELVAAACEFIAIYDAETVSDPLIRDGSWRVLRVEAWESGGQELRDQLVQAAARLVKGYDVLEQVSVASERAPRG